MTTGTLADLVGEHMLDAVDMLDEPGDANGIRFRLDGIVYLATEDEDDGYRSSMRDIVAVPDGKMANVFPAIRVVARMRSDELLDFYDVANGKTVLEVGTDTSDDYYPWFVGAFHPENMATNAAVG